MIPPRYEHIPIWKTHGRYRKQMKRGYCKMLYNQINKKDETIISVIKRLFGEHITSRLVRTQNRELSFRCITYNAHRLTNLTIITWFLQSPSFLQSSIKVLWIISCPRNHRTFIPVSPQLMDGTKIIIHTICTWITTYLQQVTSYLIMNIFRYNQIYIGHHSKYCITCCQ